MDGFLGKSDPFYTIKRIDNPGSLAETLTTVYSSPVIDNDLNPAWPKAKLALSKVSPPPGSNKCELLFEVWDKDFISDDCISRIADALSTGIACFHVKRLHDKYRVLETPAAPLSGSVGACVFEALYRPSVPRCPGDGRCKQEPLQANCEGHHGTLLQQISRRGRDRARWGRGSMSFTIIKKLK